MQALNGAEEADEERLTEEVSEAMAEQYPVAEFRYERRRSLTGELPLAGEESLTFSDYRFDALRAVCLSGTLAIQRCVDGEYSADLLVLASPYLQRRALIGLLREKLGRFGYSEHTAENTEPLETTALLDSPDQMAVLYAKEETLLSGDQTEKVLIAFGQVLSGVTGESTLRTPVTQERVWEYLDQYPGVEFRYGQRRSLTAELPFSGEGSHLFSDYEFDSVLIVCGPGYLIFQRGMEGSFETDREFLCLSADEEDLAAFSAVLTGFLA